MPLTPHDLRRLREGAGLTAQGLAELHNAERPDQPRLAFRTIYAYEKGRRPIPQHRATVLTELLTTPKP